MESKRVIVLIFLSLILMNSKFILAQTPVTINIDGDMSDWEGIPNLVNDSSDDVPGMNLIGAQVTNDTTYLYIRMSYANAYEYPLLWGNVTVRNQAEDVFILMAFVATDNTQQDTWVFPGISLNSSLNSQSAPLDDYTQHLGFAKVAPTYDSIEFKIPLSDIDSNNSTNLSELDFVFWHYDAFSAGLQLNQVTQDRVPDEGYATYYSNGSSGQTLVESDNTSSNADDSNVNYILLIGPFSLLTVVSFRRRKNQTQ